MKNKESSAQKIGVFDSGVGGLSVLRAIHEYIPAVDLLYVADQAHVPYGRRPMDEIRSFSEQIAGFLLEEGVNLIVVACNTASAAALKYLRQRFPDARIVGMEPAVKPASEQSKTRAVGVLATPATFQGELYRSLVHKYGEGLQIYQDTCKGLVEEIEAGNLTGEKTRQILTAALDPMIKKNVDTVVLGCTHYPFVLALIKEIAGNKINVIDPAPAVARRVMSLLDEQIKESNTIPLPATITFYTSGNPANFKRQIETLVGYEGNIKQIKWQNGKIPV